MEERADAAAAYWMHEHRQNFHRTLGPGPKVESDGSVVPERPRFPFALERRPLDLDALYVLAPDLVKQQLRCILSTMQYEAGPPMADSARFLAETDSHVAEIEHQHKQLVEEAGRLKASVSLAFLPAVQERREAEQAKAKRERAQREEREGIEAQVNAAVTLHSVPSPYLRANAPGRSSQS